MNIWTACLMNLQHIYDRMLEYLKDPITDFDFIFIALYSLKVKYLLGEYLIFLKFTFFFTVIFTSILINI